MESIVNIQYCICLTSITGGVISIIWYLLGRLLEKAGFLNIVYTLLKVTTIFWILPVAYISLIVVEKKFGMWHGVFIYADACFRPDIKDNLYIMGTGYHDRGS